MCPMEKQSLAGREGMAVSSRRGSALLTELWGEDCPGMREFMATGASRLRARPPRGGTAWGAQPRVSERQWLSNRGKALTLNKKRAPLYTNRKGGQKLIEDVEEIKRCYMAASLLGVQTPVSSLCPPGVGSVS